MFRNMRRARQQLGDGDARMIMAQGRTGVLAVAGDGGYPYAVPINYVWHEDKFYFHCAKEGHKLGAITREPKVSLCVVAQDQVVPEKLTTVYRSAIAFGRARVLTDADQVRWAMALLNGKYAPGLEQMGRREVEQALPRLCVVEVAVDHLTGKQDKERMAP